MTKQEDKKFAHEYTDDELDGLIQKAVQGAGAKDKKEQGGKPKYQDVGEGKGGIPMPVDE